jgi:AcrR family transcriptional regulator
MEKKAIDRRIQRTRQLLLDALVALILEKGYEDITVQDIIDRANVGRSTFYAHFQDREDLFLSGFESLRDQFEGHLLGGGNGPMDPWGLSLILFEHVQGSQRLFKAMMGQQSRGGMTQHFNKYLVMLIRSHMKTQMPDKVREQVPPDIMAQVAVSTLTALLTWWLDNDLPYTAERMNQMYQALLRPGIEALMQ